MRLVKVNGVECYANGGETIEDFLQSVGFKFNAFPSSTEPSVLAPLAAVALAA